MSRTSRIIKAGSPRQAEAQHLDLFDLHQPTPLREGRRENHFHIDEHLVAAQTQAARPFRAEFGAAGAAALARSEEEGAAAEPAPPTPEEVLIQAETEAENIRRKAHQEGFESGRVEAAAQMTEAAERLMRAAGEMNGQQQAILRELEQEIIDLVLLAVSKVVTQELKINKEVVVGAVQAALERVGRSRSVKIRLNPEDLALITERKSELEMTHPRLSELDLMADPDVALGGCVVETEFEEIDSTLETRLASLSEVMEQVLKGAGRGD